MLKDNFGYLVPILCVSSCVNEVTNSVIVTLNISENERMDKLFAGLKLMIRLEVLKADLMSLEHALGALLNIVSALRSAGMFQNSSLFHQSSGPLLMHISNVE